MVRYEKIHWMYHPIILVGGDGVQERGGFFEFWCDSHPTTDRIPIQDKLDDVILASILEMAEQMLFWMIHFEALKEDPSRLLKLRDEESARTGPRPGEVMVLSSESLPT